MEWRDEGILLSARRHGETSVIAEVFTAQHGRHSGVIRGGTSRKMAPTLQPGAQIDVAWRARLEEHVGTYSVEPIRSRTAVLQDRLMLAGMNSVLALLLFSLPEREPHHMFYRNTVNLLDLLGDHDLWPLGYLNWELALLEELGFGLDLTRCAVTGAASPLEFVSPRTGRAVSRDGAQEWADRLLPLPPVMLGQGDASHSEILQGLGVTGYFLRNRLAAELADKPLPDARARYLDRLTARESANPAG